MGDNKGKIWIAGGLALMVLAAVIFLLFVLPGLSGQDTSYAQGDPPGGGPGGPPGGGPGGPPGGGPGGPPGGGPGGPPGGGPGGPPGGGPGGMPGAPGGMGVEGGMGGAAVPAAPAEKLAPLEGSRPNPFLPRGMAAGPDGGGATVPRVTRYGADWSRWPITYRMGFVRPHVPAPRAVAPPEPTPEPATDLIVTSILWTQDGQAMAVYESGPPERRKSGVVKPGDIVDDWQVIEIWRDRVVVADRQSGRQRSVPMTVKKAAPATPSTPTPPAGGGSTGGRGRTRPGAAPTVRQ